MLGFPSFTIMNRSNKYDEDDNYFNHVELRHKSPLVIVKKFECKFPREMSIHSSATRTWHFFSSENRENSDLRESIGRKGSARPKRKSWFNKESCIKFPLFETQSQHIALSLDLYDPIFNNILGKVARVQVLKSSNMWF